MDKSPLEKLKAAYEYYKSCAREESSPLSHRVWYDKKADECLAEMRARRNKPTVQIRTVQLRVK